MNRKEFQIWKTEKERKFNDDLKALRNDFASRGLFYSGMRQKAEERLKQKFDSDVEIVRIQMVQPQEIKDFTVKQSRKSFWASLLGQILKYKKLLIVLIFLVVALLLILINGWKFIPEINIPYIGKVVPPQNNAHITQTAQQIISSSTPETSKQNTLSGSIYSVFSKLDEAKTTLDRQELFKRYVGLIVHDQGFILDISKSENGGEYYVDIGKSRNVSHWKDTISCELFDRSSVNVLLTRDNSQIISFEGVIQRDSLFYLALSRCILGE